MDSDDRRPDDSRPRFSLRTLLSPDDGPGDGSTVDHDVAGQAFGTGGADDAELDALVMGTVSETEPVEEDQPVIDQPIEEDEPVMEGASVQEAEPTFVWAAGEVPEPLPGVESEEATAHSSAPEALSGEAPSEAPPGGVAEVEPLAAPLEAAAPDPADPAPITAPAAEFFGGVDDPLEAFGREGVDETPDVTEDADQSPDVSEGAVATEDAAATGGVAAATDAFSHAETEGAVPVGAAAAAPEDVSSADSEADADRAVTDLAEADAGVDAAAGLTADMELETRETTDAVDDAFEIETDAAKADAPGLDGPDGTLEVEPLGPEDFEPDELRAVLRTMMTSRRLDHKMLTLLKQGKGFFHIGSAGHEASQIAVASHFEGGKDWFCFYYRDLATALTVGVTPTEVLRAHFGKAADVFGGGRQMPEHFGHRELNILSTSSSVAAQYVPAVGFALGVKREDAETVADGGPSRAVYASGGEGSTSQGAFHEALNWAAREALPVLFHVQDNKYAISVPVAEQTAGGSIWHLLGGYAGLERIRYDGTDFFQSVAAARAAMDHIRAGRGPVALHADLVRLLPHSSSDDHRKYREAESIEADAARDPIPRFAARLVEAGLLTDADVAAMEAEVAAEIDRIARAVAAEPDPAPAEALRHVLYEGPDERQYEVEGETGDLIVMVDAINHALDEEMTRDERVLVYGEDVGGGKGGVFTATRGLTEKHGRDRCFNSPLAEHSVIGSAVGLAASGYMPVVEIQFADYIWPGMQPLRNQVASMRYRSNGTWANPMVLRIPCGGYIHGGLCHSQNIEALFSHWPGLQVVMPSNAADAKGLLKTAIRGHDPVLFLEHKALYRQGPARRPEPHADYLVPLGKAAVAREGTDLTLVTWGAIVYKALNVAKTLEKEGVSVEVVDVRSFLPFDTETVLASACKTGRVLVAYEDHEFMGFGAEIAAQVSDAAFGYLDAPVKRVAGAFSSIPYADVLEKEVLPQDDDVLAAAREVLAY